MSARQNGAEWLLWLATTYLRWKPRLSIKLSDGRTMEILAKVLPSEVELLRSGTPSPNFAHSVADWGAAPGEDIRLVLAGWLHVLQPCPSCRALGINASYMLKRGVTGRRPSGFLDPGFDFRGLENSIDGEKVMLIDWLMRVSPALCIHAFQTSMLDMPGFIETGWPLGVNTANWLHWPVGQNRYPLVPLACVHKQRLESVDITSNVFGQWSLGWHNLHSRDELELGCFHCNPNVAFGWDAETLEKALKWSTPWHRATTTSIDCLIQFRYEYSLLPEPGLVVLTYSRSPSLADISLPVIANSRTYVIVSTLQQRAVVRQKGAYPIYLVNYGTERFIEAGMVLVASVLPGGTKVLMLEPGAVVENFLPLKALTHSRPAILGGSSAVPWKNDVAWVVAGALSVFRHMSFTAVGILGGTPSIIKYAFWRGAALAFIVEPRILAPTFAWELVDGVVYGKSWVLVEPEHNLKGIVAYPATAFRLKSAILMYLQTTRSNEIRPTLFDVMNAPIVVSEQRPHFERHVSEKPIDFGPSDNSLGSLVSRRLGRITFLPFGSLGDLVPIRAYVSWLVSYGFEAEAVMSHTSAEGQQILTWTEQGEMYKATRAYLRHLALVATHPGVTYAPAEFRLSSCHYSLKPPREVLTGLRFGVGTLFDLFASRILSTTPMLINIGSYSGIDWAPRSSDGVSFLKASTNRKRPVPAILAWGSCSLPKPSGDWVEVAPGDHYAQFERAELVLCHGGAGTVQTAAAAGARVVTLTGTLDRGYKDPFDAGRDVKPGTHPVRILFSALLQDLSVWIFIARVAPWQLIPAIAFIVREQGARSFWIALALWKIYWSSGATLIVAFDLAETLVATILAPVLGAGLALFLAGFVTTAIKEFAYWAGYEGADLALLIYRSLLEVSSSWVSYLVLSIAPSRTGVLVSLLWVLGFRPLVSGALVLLDTLTSSRSDDTADALFYFIYVEGIPLIHARLANQQRTRMFDGTHVGTIEGFGGLYQTSTRAFVSRPEFMVSLPTAIPWSVIEGQKASVAVYSAAWNCQTAPLVLFGAWFKGFGAALLVFLPMTLVAGVVWVVAAGFILIGYFIVNMAPEAISVLKLTGFGFDFDWLERQIIRASNALLDPRSTLLGRLVAIGSVVATGWADAPADGPESEVIGLSAALASPDFRLGLNVSNVDTRVRALVLKYPRAFALPLANQLLVSVVRQSLRADPSVGPSTWVADVPADTMDLVRGVWKAALSQNKGYLGVEGVISQEHFVALGDVIENGAIAVDLSHGPTEVPVPLSELLCAVCQVYRVDLQTIDPNVDRFWLTLIDRIEEGLAAFPIYGHADDADLSAWISGLPATDPPSIIPVLKFVFFSPSHTGKPVAIEGISVNMLSDFGHMAADVVSITGVDHNSAVLAAALEACVHVSNLEGPAPFSTAMAKRLFDAYCDIRAVTFGPLERAEEFIVWLRRFCYEENVWLAAPLDAVFQWSARIFSEVAKLWITFVGMLWGLAIELRPDDAEKWNAIGTMLYAVSDLVDVRHRQNPKTVWGLLAKRVSNRIRNSEAMLMSLPTYTYEPSSSYQEWALELKNQFLGIGFDEAVHLPTEPPSRQVHVPKVTYGYEEDNLLPLAHDVKFIETERERNMKVRLLAKSRPLGIDGTYLATGAVIQSSLDRYTVTRPILDSYAKLLIRQSADTLYDSDPDLYRFKGTMSIANTMKAMKWKYSSGLPFMGYIKTRQQLRASDWYQAIAKVADLRLRSGVMRQVFSHGFPKAQVVPREKILNDPSAIRTVTAASFFDSIAPNAIMMSIQKGVPSPDSLVLNTLPRREGGFQHVYEALGRFDKFYACDAWRFDSTVPREVATIGSVRLVERGFSGQWGERAAVSMAQAYYEGLASGVLVNLATGELTQKTGGGGTGSAWTSTDNRNWVRIIMIASWAAATGNRPDEFFDNVVLANASDDIILSIKNTPHVEEFMNRWSATALSLFGFKIAFDERPGPHPVIHLDIVPPDEVSYSDYEAVDVVPPQWPVRHDPARLDLMRSNYRSDRMRYNKLVAADYITQRAVGHALLTAHNREGYHEIANDWLDACTEFLEGWFENVEWTVLKGNDSFITGVVLKQLDGVSPELKRNMAKRQIPISSSRGKSYIATTQLRARKWYRIHRLPSYLEVFKLWVTPEDYSRIRDSQKRWSKLVLNPQISLPVLDLARNSLVGFSSFLESLPGALTRGVGGFSVNVPAKPFLTHDMVIESFVWRRFLQNHDGRRPTPGEFMTLIKLSPYAAACDATAFLVRMQDPEFTNYMSGMPDSKGRVLSDDAISGRTAMYTAIYACIDWLILIARDSRLLSFAAAMLIFWTRDLDRYYSTLNLLYWHATGTSSSDISNLMPRDAFLVQKVLAGIFLAAVPRAFTDNFMGIDSLMKRLTVISDLLTRGMKVKLTASSVILKSITGVANPWSDVIADLRGLAMDRDPVQLEAIVGGVGTGKSTLMIATAWETQVWTTIFIVLPTNVLVNEYVNDFIEPSLIHRVSAGMPVPLGGIIVITAGYFSVATVAPDQLKAALVILDEAHTQQTEQVICWQRASYRSRLLVSATPTGVLFQNVEGRTRHVKGTARYNVTKASVEQLDGKISANTISDEIQRLSMLRPEETKRALVIHPSIAVLEVVATQLRAMALPAAVVSSSSPFVPIEGIVLATTIVDAGINIRPPPPMLIDTGLEFVSAPRWTVGNVSDLGQILLHEPVEDRVATLELQPTSVTTAKQRWGRVGREREGVIYCSPQAGQGPPLPYRASILHHLRRFGTAHDLESWTQVKILVVPSVPKPSSAFDWIFVDPLPPHMALYRGEFAITFLLACALGGFSAAEVSLNLHYHAKRPQPEVILLLADAASNGFSPSTRFEDFNKIRAGMIHVGVFMPGPGGIKRKVRGSPLMHYIKTIAPCGTFGSPDAELLYLGRL